MTGTPSTQEALWRRVAGRWDRFWYPRGNPTSLAVFRILFALALLWEVSASAAKSDFAMAGGFHVPYVPFIAPVSEALYNAMHDWQYPLIALMLFGVLTRPAIGLLILLQGYIFFSDQLVFRNHPYVFLLVLAFLFVSPCDRALSLRSWLGSVFARKHKRPVPDANGYLLTGQQLIKFQVSIAYFFAALHKLTPAYLSGQVMAELMSRDVFAALSGKLIGTFGSPATIQWLRDAVAEPGNWIVVSWVTVLLELSLPIALWIPRTRRVAMLCGIPFHIGIALAMSIYTFSLAMIGSYVLFLDTETIPRFWERVRGRNGRQVSAKGKQRKRTLNRA